MYENESYEKSDEEKIAIINSQVEEDSDEIKIHVKKTKSLAQKYAQERNITSI